VAAASILIADDSANAASSVNTVYALQSESLTIGMCVRHAAKENTDCISGDAIMVSWLVSWGNSLFVSLRTQTAVCENTRQIP
jgi:hypothetical protein